MISYSCHFRLRRRASLHETGRGIARHDSHLAGRRQPASRATADYWRSRRPRFCQLARHLSSVCADGRIRFAAADSPMHPMNDAQRDFWPRRFRQMPQYTPRLTCWFSADCAAPRPAGPEHVRRRLSGIGHAFSDGGFGDWGRSSCREAAAVEYAHAHETARHRRFDWRRTLRRAAADAPLFMLLDEAMADYFGQRFGMNDASPPQKAAEQDRYDSAVVAISYRAMMPMRLSHRLFARS